MSQHRRSTPSPISPLAALLFLGAAAVFLLVNAWRENSAGDPSVPLPGPGQTAQALTPTPGDAIAIYFSDPLAGKTVPGPETHLVDAINGAQRSVDMAIYNLSLPALADALIHARDRGIAVRLVMESEAMDGSVPQRLRDAGIDIRTDRREGLMHNKFTVIDEQEVWSGSMNYTSTASYSDYNNLVRLRSTRAARDYTVEFEEMYVEDLFGPDDRPATPYPQVTINGVTVEIYFSPDDGAAAQIIAEINDASQTIDFLAYSLTSDPISRALLAAKERGVRVRGVFDKDQVASNTGGEFDVLDAAGIPVRLDGIPGLMHHKVIIIDGQTVITGSYNFSGNAERTNDENILIFHDPTTAGAFARHFEQVWEGGR